MKRLHKNKGLGLEREAGVDSCCGSPEVNWRRVTGQTGITLFSFPECMFWTHAKRQNTHTLRSETTNRRIEPSPLTKRLSPLCLSICVYKAMCVLLFDGLCTDGVCLSVLLSASTRLTTCLFMSIRSSGSAGTSGCTLHAIRPPTQLSAKMPAPSSALVHVDIGGPSLIEGFLNQSLLLNPSRSKTNTGIGFIRGVNFRWNWHYYASIKTQLTFR